jgi:hypothetical protein
MPVADPVAHHNDVDSVERCRCFSEGGPPSKCELLAMSFLASCKCDGIRCAARIKSVGELLKAMVILAILIDLLWMGACSGSISRFGVIFLLSNSLQ